MHNAHIIIAGDSNALGFLNEGPAPYAVTVRVQIWVDLDGDGVGDSWNYMQPGVNTGTVNQPHAWGAEVQIANRWLAENPNGYLWIVKGTETVKGGSTLAGHWDPETGNMFASATRAAQNAMRNLEGGEFAFDQYDVAFIGLGENDAVNPEWASAYLSNLVTFNEEAREAWSVEKLVQYRITTGAGSAQDNLTVRQAQWQADQADPDLYTFRTDGFAMLPDGIHYADYVALGNASYDGWMTL